MIAVTSTFQLPSSVAQKCRNVVVINIVHCALDPPRTSRNRWSPQEASLIAVHSAVQCNNALFIAEGQRTERFTATLAFFCPSALLSLHN